MPARRRAEICKLRIHRHAGPHARQAVDDDAIGGREAGLDDPEVSFDAPDVDGAALDDVAVTDDVDERFRLIGADRFVG